MAHLKSWQHHLSWIALLAIAGCYQPKIMMPPLANICGGTSPYFAFDAQKDPPKIVSIAPLRNLSLTGADVAMSIVPNVPASYVAITSYDAANIYVVPYSIGPVKNGPDFAIDAANILQGEWALDPTPPIEHLRARQLLYSSMAKPANKPNPMWEQSLAVWRDRALKERRNFSFFRPSMHSRLLGIASIVLLDTKDRKVICFVAVDAPKAAAEKELGACVAILYGFLGPEFDYNVDTSDDQNMLKQETLEQCAKEIRKQALLVANAKTLK
jgi:hypothetical protein